MSYGLTQRQVDLLRFIQGYQRAHGGVSPSIVECAVGIGVVNKSNASRLLAALEERGAIRRLPNRKRGIEVLTPDLPVPSIAGAPLYAVPALAGAPARFEPRRLTPREIYA